MGKYPKIQTIYLRNPKTRHRTLLEGQYALPEFEYLADNKWLFSEKIDGTNVRVSWDGARIIFGGRTERAQLHATLYAKLQELFPPEKFAALYPDVPMTLYGEGYGAKIQKGGGNYIPDGVNFILFDVRINDTWLERENVEDIAAKLNIDTVPIVGRGSLLDAIEIARIGFQSQVAAKERMAEGIVLRPTVELLNRRGHRIIAKIKHKDFA